MTTTATTATHKWRFGYGSNLGLKTLREKKNLAVSRYLVGTIQGYELCKLQDKNEKPLRSLCIAALPAASIALSEPHLLTLQCTCLSTIIHCALWAFYIRFYAWTQ